MNNDRLKELEQEFAALSGTFAFQAKTPMDRLMVVAHKRLLETLAYGEPKTPLPSTHHK